MPAYSTLGWFNDPVISTFIHYPEAELARLIFHELAHQVAYAPGDSAFNESFATAVEQAGLQRWLDVHGDARMRQSYAAHVGAQARFPGFAAAGIGRHWKPIMPASAPDAEKLQSKAEIFQSLQGEYQTLKQSWGGYAGYDRWFAEPLSNAHLAALATYHDLVPGFQRDAAKGPAFRSFLCGCQGPGPSRPGAAPPALAGTLPAPRSAPVLTLRCRQPRLCGRTACLLNTGNNSGARCSAANVAARALALLLRKGLALA